MADRILASRGISDPETVSAFLAPSLTHLHDPSLIPELDRAAGRLLEALKASEPIVIYGDYDVDGITATAILFHTLLAIRPGAPVSTYVPHRLEEGYGLNSDALRALATAGTKVVVSVDCGVTAVEPARIVRELGLDLIITDHHHPPERVEDLPQAVAVVHPGRPDSAYPFADLSGAGVAYKLAWRLLTLHCGRQKIDPHFRALLVELLAFAALGSIADVVPLVGENRVIARFGLVRAKHSPFVGLRALVEASGLSGENIDAMAVGFKLGPRLNAAGRMGHARDAVELFTTADAPRARVIAEQLSELNTKRRTVERSIFEHACELAESGGMTGTERRAIVLAHEDWHAGVVGIVCSRLVEKYHRPTILLQRTACEGGMGGRGGGWSCHGSGRSITGFDLHAGLRFCAPHLEKYGGHTMAAGLTLAGDRLDSFVASFTAYANQMIQVSDLTPALIIDAEASAGELTVVGVELLEKLEPCGAGNPQPRVLVRNLVVSQPAKMLGEAGKHLSLQVRVGGGGREVLRCVGWGWGEHVAKFAPGVAFDAVVKPTISHFTGTPRVELELCDVAIGDAGGAGIAPAGTPEKVRVRVRGPVPTPLQQT